MRITLLLVLLVFFIAVIPSGAQDTDVKLSTPEQIKEDFNTVPVSAY